MGFIAGLGWLFDAAVYLAFATATGQVFLANILGNCCGIAFAFIFGAKYAFRYRGVFLYKQLVMYAMFAFAMMPIFSAILTWLVAQGILGLVGAKILVTIPSFLANYMCMKLLMRPFHA